MPLITIPVTIELLYSEVPPENRAKYTVSRSVQIPDIEGEVDVSIFDISGQPPQVQLTGSSKSLEALGSFLVALGRLDTDDPNPHEHFQLKGEHGSVEFIVRRSK